MLEMEKRVIGKHCMDGNNKMQTICQVAVPNNGSVNVIEVTNKMQTIWFTIPINGRMYIKTPFAKCEPCQKQFNGPVPLQQHLNCIKHKNKCGKEDEALRNQLSNEISIKVLSKAKL